MLGPASIAVLDASRDVEQQRNLHCWKINPRLGQHRHLDAHHHRGHAGILPLVRPIGQLALLVERAVLEASVLDLVEQDRRFGRGVLVVEIEAIEHRIREQQLLAATAIAGERKRLHIGAALGQIARHRCDETHRVGTTLEHVIGVRARVATECQRHDPTDLAAHEFLGDAQTVGAIDCRFARMHRTHGSADRAVSAGQKQSEQHRRKHDFEQGEAG